MLNFFFILVYVILSRVFSGAELYAICTLHFVIMAVQQLRQKSLRVTPLLLYYVGVIIVNIANINLINNLGSAAQIKSYNYIVIKYIDDAALIWCISSAMFVIGYDFYRSKSFPAIAFEIKNKKILTYIFYFLVLENVLLILGSGITLRGNQLGKLTVLLNTIGILFFAQLWARNEKKQYRNYTIVLYLLETYVSLLTSYLRFELILPTFYLFVGYFIGKGHIKYIFSYRIVPLLLILTIFSTVFADLQKHRSNFIDVFTGNKPPEGSGDPDEHTSSSLLGRSANVAQITNVVKLVEHNGFYNGRASEPIIIALVPRFLWPDKPLIQLGSWFALEIGVATKSQFAISNNSINMTVAGELYLDFGWLGVVIGSFLFGAFISMLWNATQFYSSEYNLAGIIFGGYLIQIAVGGYADLQIVVTLISSYGLFFIIKKIVAGRK